MITVDHKHRTINVALRAGHSSARACGDALSKLDPRHQVENPVMFVVWVGKPRHDAPLVFRRCFGTGEAPDLVYPRRDALALVHRALCQFCGSDGGRPGQSTSRLAAASPTRD